MRNINDSLAVVNLDVSMWAGRANVRAEDLPASVVDSLPPADIATLGTKRLFPRDALKVFQTIKMRAYNLCCQHGTRFLSGFAVDKNAVPQLCSDLDIIKGQFDAAVKQFLTTYDEGCRNWQMAYRQWANILASATPSVGEVARRFNFSYQVFAVSSVAPADAHDSLAEDIKALPLNALEDIATDARNLVRDSYTDKRDTIEGRGLNPLKSLLDKMDALAFLHPDIRRLYDVLNEARLHIQATGGKDIVSVHALRALLAACSNAQSIRYMVSAITEGQKGAPDVWQEFLTPCAPEPETVTPEPETVTPEPAPAVSPTALISNLLATL